MSNTIDSDEDARVMASMINGTKSDPYWTPAQQPSREDEIVYDNYEKALGVVNNPDDYDADEVDEIIGIIRDDYRDQFSSYDGNYKADISENEFVKKFYQEYKRKKLYYNGCITKINNQKYQCEKKKTSDIIKARKNKPNDLGKEMKLLIDKVEAILTNKQELSDSDSE